MDFDLNRKAAKVIRSLMRELLVSDHLVLPEGEKAISARRVVELLEEQGTDKPTFVVEYVQLVEGEAIFTRLPLTEWPEWAESLKGFFK